MDCLEEVRKFYSVDSRYWEDLQRNLAALPQCGPRMESSLVAAGAKSGTLKAVCDSVAYSYDHSVRHCRAVPKGFVGSHGVLVCEMSYFSHQVDKIWFVIAAVPRKSGFCRGLITSALGKSIESAYLYGTHFADGMATLGLLLSADPPTAPVEPRGDRSSAEPPTAPIERQGDRAASDAHRQIQSLVSKLGHKIRAQREDAIESLTAVGKGAVDALIAAMQGKDFSTIYESEEAERCFGVIEVLTRIRDARGIPTLLTVAKTGELRLARSAAKALLRLGDLAVQQTLTLLREGNPNTTLELVFAIEECRKSEIRSLYAKALTEMLAQGAFGGSGGKYDRAHTLVRKLTGA